jgi:hypothetical protein
MLETRVAGATDPKFWTPICNGTLVSIHGALRVMTAAHCLDYSEGHPSTYARPTNVTSGLLYQYGFLRYQAAGPPVVLQKAAVAGTVDLALFSILPSDPNAGQLPATAALPFANPDTTLSGAPVNVTAEAGSEGISTAVINPETDGSTLTGSRRTTSRIYLGRIKDPSSPRFVDVWADNVTTPDQDSCYFGGSGSSTIAAGGWVTGPMSFRDYLGTKSPHDTDEDPLDGRKAWRAAADQELGFDTSNFITVCTTAVVNATTVSAVSALA